MKTNDGNTSSVEKVKRFRSCFICGVEMHDKVIVLEDSGRNQFFIDTSNKTAMASFLAWFKNIYLKGIPQILSIIDYAIVNKNDDESMCLVNKIVANPHPYQQSQASSCDDSSSSKEN